MAFHATKTHRRLMAVVLAAGLATVAGAAGAQGRATSGERSRPEPGEALRKRLAEHRYFEIVQNSLRTSPPQTVPMVIPPRFR